MPTKTRKALLTNRAGQKRRMALVIHAPAHSLQMGACGISFAALCAQDFAVHQTALAGDLSDVTCTKCLAVVAPSSRIYPLSCTSAYCGKAGDACTACPRNAARLEFEAWCELRQAKRPDEVWCPSFWQATTKVGGR